jgi:hypothetical protein
MYVWQKQKKSPDAHTISMLQWEAFLRHPHDRFLHRATKRAAYCQDELTTKEQCEKLNKNQYEKETKKWSVHFNTAVQ